jgi:hypothetical protein
MRRIERMVEQLQQQSQTESSNNFHRSYCLFEVRRVESHSADPKKMNQSVC